MRIATYNVEWFANLFDRDNRLYNDGGWSGREDVTRAQQTEAVGLVFKTMDADAVMVIEAPDSSRHQSSEAALEHFAQAFDLRTTKALTGFENPTQQEITLLYDPTKFTAVHDPKGDPTGKHATADGPRFDGVFRIDLDMDERPESVRFSKPPLEVELTPIGGKPIRLIGTHIKSKSPHGASNLNEQILISIDNRRKQLAQCIWIRQRVEAHLNANESVIVLGDFNDGPGIDGYEKLFGRSGVEIVLGDQAQPEKMLFDPHARAALMPRPTAHHTSARFMIYTEGKYLNALLDFVMVSPDINASAPKWRIWHPFDDPACFEDSELSTALLTASDHFPVTIDFEQT